MLASEAKEKIKNYCNGCVGNFQGYCEKTCEFPTIIKALDLLEKQEQNRIIECETAEVKQTIYEAIEKQNEVRIKWEANKDGIVKSIFCPSCGRFLTDYYAEAKNDYKYCNYCGQRVEVEE